MGKFVNDGNVPSYLDVGAGGKHADSKNANQSDLSVSGNVPQLELLCRKSKAALVTFAIKLLLQTFLCAQINDCIRFSRDVNGSKSCSVDSHQANVQ